MFQKSPAYLLLPDLYQSMKNQISNTFPPVLKSHINNNKAQLLVHEANDAGEMSKETTFRRPRNHAVTKTQERGPFQTHPLQFKKVVLSSFYRCTNEP
jgi:hypothetical protein